MTDKTPHTPLPLPTTAKPKWTPGPLESGKIESGTIIRDGRVLYRMVPILGLSRGTLEADAQLYSAAPDMAEALEKLKSYNEDIRDGKINYRPEDHLFYIERALARARGEE
jgi:hypothetical protein